AAVPRVAPVAHQPAALQILCQPRVSGFEDGWETGQPRPAYLRGCEALCQDVPQCKSVHTGYFRCLNL
ncbi:unnamed protein product, partial [Closterium sp. NIES-54]